MNDEVNEAVNEVQELFEDLLGQVEQKMILSALEEIMERIEKIEEFLGPAYREHVGLKMFLTTGIEAGGTVLFVESDGESDLGYNLRWDTSHLEEEE